MRKNDLEEVQVQVARHHLRSLLIYKAEEYLPICVLNQFPDSSYVHGHKSIAREIASYTTGWEDQSNRAFLITGNVLPFSSTSHGKINVIVLLEAMRKDCLKCSCKMELNGIFMQMQVGIQAQLFFDFLLFFFS